MSGYFLVLVAWGLLVWTADVLSQREANKLERERQRRALLRNTRATEVFEHERLNQNKPSRSA